MQTLHETGVLQGHSLQPASALPPNLCYRLLVMGKIMHIYVSLACTRHTYTYVHDAACNHSQYEFRATIVVMHLSVQGLLSQYITAGDQVLAAKLLLLK